MASAPRPWQDTESGRTRVTLAYELSIGGEIEPRELPLVIGVLAPLTGLPENQAPALRARKFVPVDRENLDVVMERHFKPRLLLSVPNLLDETAGISLCVELRFGSLDDFAPEAVARQIEPLRKLLAARTRLIDLRSSLNDDLEPLLQAVLFDQELLRTVEGDLAEHSPPVGSLADQLLKATRVEESAARESLRELAAQARASELRVSRDVEAMLTARITSFDAAIARQVTAVLHHPEFQALEASWRGLALLVGGLATDTVIVRVLSLTKDELKRDQERAMDVTRSGLYRLCQEEYEAVLAGHPYGLLVGDYAFEHSSTDVFLLERLSEVAASIHAPFIAGVSPNLMNLDHFEDLPVPRDLVKIFDTVEHQRWRRFRVSEHARYVGLVLPRVLMRAPYGQAGQAIDAFEYDEVATAVDERSYVWGNAAYVLALRIGDAFTRHGWCATIRGAETGGMTTGLVAHSLVDEAGAPFRVGPTEVSVSDRRLLELDRLGLIALCQDKRAELAVFFHTPSAARPQVFDTEDANAAARSATRLEYVLAAAQALRCLKAIVRDGDFPADRARDWEARLNQWLAGYVEDRPDVSTTAERPLRAARVTVREVRDHPGVYDAVVFIQPEYQLAPLPVPLRFLSRLAQRSVP